MPDLGDLRRRSGFSEHPDQIAQKLRERAQEQAEVVASGGGHGVNAIALTSLEMVAVHAVLGLEVTDHGLDGGTALFISRRIAAVTRCTWPDIQTRNSCE